MKVGEKGGVLAETAIILPLIIFLIFFLIEMSFILLQFIAVREGLSIAARDISLPKKTSDENQICNEIVNTRLTDQMRAFKQKVRTGQFLSVVKRVSPSEIAIYVDVNVYCFICGVIYEETPFNWRFEEPVILQDEEPPCDVDN